MTGSAICQTGMAKTGALPGTGAVAGRTLTTEVVGRFITGMAGLTISCPDSLMVEISRFPGRGTVTG